MMNMATASGAPVLREVGGRQVEFRPLTRRAIAALMARWRATDRAALVARLEECGIAGVERFRELDAFDRERLSLSEGLRCAFSFDRSLDVVEAGLTNGTKIDDVDLTPDEMVALAAELMGYRIKAEGDAGRPLAESASQPTTATGA